jgi:hypothetical protein
LASLICASVMAAIAASFGPEIAAQIGGPDAKRERSRGTLLLSTTKPPVSYPAVIEIFQLQFPNYSF